MSSDSSSSSSSPSSQSAPPVTSGSGSLSSSFSSQGADGCEFYLCLQRLASRHNPGAGQVDGKRIRYQVTRADNIPGAPDGEIFAYVAEPLDPGDPTTMRAQFSHVSSTVDLEEYPLNEPRPTDDPPWFRMNYVDVKVRSLSEVDLIIRDLESDIQCMMDSLAIQCEVIGEADLCFGDDPNVVTPTPPPASSSVSSQSSDSSSVPASDSSSDSSGSSESSSSSSA